MAQDTNDDAAPDMGGAEHQSSGHDVFRFNDLPAELQVRIIEFAVIEEKPINITWITDETNGNEIAASANPYQPSLSRVSKSIRAEALKAYYRYNSFKACSCDEYDDGELSAWLRAIGRKNRQLLHDLSISQEEKMDDDDGGDFCIFDRTHPLTGILEDMGAVWTEPEGAYGTSSVKFPAQTA